MVRNKFLKPTDYLGYDGCILFPSIDGTNTLIRLNNLEQKMWVSNRVNFTPNRLYKNKYWIVGIFEYYWIAG